MMRQLTPIKCPHCDFEHYLPLAFYLDKTDGELFTCEIADCGGSFNVTKSIELVTTISKVEAVA